jgi:hypothetical protein
VLVFALAVALAFLAYLFLTTPDRSFSRRMGDAVNDLPHVDKASQDLQDRTPGQRLGDTIKNNTDGH